MPKPRKGSRKQTRKRTPYAGKYPPRLGISGKAQDMLAVLVPCWDPRCACQPGDITTGPLPA